MSVTDILPEFSLDFLDFVVLNPFQASFAAKVRVFIHAFLRTQVYLSTFVCRSRLFYLDIDLSVCLSVYLFVHRTVRAYLA